MVTVSHVSGPLAGKSENFDDKKDRIEFGRDPDVCDVVYPADDTTVGRRHFALRREPSGDWAVDVYGDHFVDLDGVPVEPDQPVPSGAVLHLGRSDGPGFKVIVEREDASTKLGLTAIQDKPAPVRVLLRRLAIGGGVVAVALAAAIGGWVVYERAEREAERKRIAATYASLVEKQQELSQAQPRDDAGRIGQKAIDKLVRATFLVFRQDKEGHRDAQASAWVVGPDLLATNSHVAEIGDELEPGEKLFVRQPGAKGATFEVVEWIKHPGYKAFPRYLLGKDTSYLPAFRSSKPQEMIDLGGGGYDVGLLRVKGKLPKDAILEIAPKDEIMALTPGMALASAGYPMEQISGRQVLPIGATPQVRFGNLNALTDYFFLPTDAAHSFLIHHSVPSAGGASGSAIMGPSGRVVAVLNAGNYYFLPHLPRIGVAAGIGYAQRADLVTDMVQKRADAAFEADKSYWDWQMSNFKRGVDAFGDWVLEKHRGNSSSVPEIVSENKGKLEAADLQVGKDGKNQRVKVTRLDMSSGKTYTVFVYADNQTAIKFYLVDAHDQKAAESSGDNWYPSLNFKPPADDSWSLYVVGPDEDTTYTVKIYSWRAKDS
jgi:pSer/pThr/pTyr-binding forkhead associated (FHA) protein